METDTHMCVSFRLSHCHPKVFSIEMMADSLPLSYTSTKKEKGLSLRAKDLNVQWKQWKLYLKKNCRIELPLQGVRLIVIFIHLLLSSSDIHLFSHCSPLVGNREHRNVSWTVKSRDQMLWHAYQWPWLDLLILVFHFRAPVSDTTYANVFLLLAKSSLKSNPFYSQLGFS